MLFGSSGDWRYGLGAMGFVYLLLTIIVAYLGWASRDAEYRIVAWTIFIGSRLTGFFYSNASDGWLGPNVGVVAIDALATLIFGYVAFTSRKFWPIWITPLQFGALLSHFSSNLASEVVSYAVGMMQGFWAWVQLAILLIVAARSGAGPSSRQP